MRQKGSRYVLGKEHGWQRLNELPITKQTRSIGWVRVTQAYQAGWYYLMVPWAKGAAEPW